MWFCVVLLVARWSLSTGHQRLLLQPRLVFASRLAIHRNWSLFTSLFLLIPLFSFCFLFRGYGTMNTNNKNRVVRTSARSAAVALAFVGRSRSAAVGADRSNATETRQCSSVACRCDFGGARTLSCCSFCSCPRVVMCRQANKTFRSSRGRRYRWSLLLRCKPRTQTKWS